MSLVTPQRISDSIGDIVRLFEGGLGLLSSTFVILLMIAFGPSVVLALFVVALLYIVFRHPEVGMYVLVLLTPMTGLVISADMIAEATGGFMAGSSFSALAVDSWAIILIVLFGVRMLLRWVHYHEVQIVMPGVWLYGLFLAASIASLVHLSSFEISEGIKYLIRFPLFVYLAYLVVGINSIETKQVLRRSLIVYVWVGVLAAALGLLSLIINVSGLTGLYRAVPISLFGIDLFNYAGDVRFGHILLAEHLTTVIPIAIYIAYTAKEQLLRRRYEVVSLFLVVMCLLTFSRAGWLTLMFQAGVFVLLFRSYIPWKRIAGQLMLAGAVFALFALYMLSTLSSSVVASSNSARIVLTEIGWEYFLEKPIFGQGIGRYEVILEDVGFFTYHFGDPIDAHSILTKISTEQGIVGLLTFGLFVGWILISIYKRMQHEGFSSRARIAAFLSFFLILTPLIFQLFNTQYYAARMWVPFMLALSLVFLYRHDRSSVSAYVSFLPERKKPLISNVFSKR